MRSGIVRTRLSPTTDTYDLYVRSVHTCPPSIRTLPVLSTCLFMVGPHELTRTDICRSDGWRDCQHAYKERPSPLFFIDRRHPSFRTYEHEAAYSSHESIYEPMTSQIPEAIRSAMKRRAEGRGT